MSVRKFRVSCGGRTIRGLRNVCAFAPVTARREFIFDMQGEILYPRDSFEAFGGYGPFIMSCGSIAEANRIIKERFPDVFARKACTLTVLGTPMPEQLRFSESTQGVCQAL